MNFWIRQLTAHIRSSQLALVAPLLIVLGVLNARQQMWPGLFIWENRGSAVTTALIVLNPLLAACGAWDGISRRSQDIGRLWRTATANRNAAAGLLFLGTAVPTFMLYAIIAIISHLPIGVPGVPEGGPEWVWLLAGLGAAFTSASLGLLAGLVLPYFVTVIGVGVATYVLGAIMFLVGSGIQPALGMLSPSTAILVEPYFGVRDSLFAEQVAWFSSLTALAVVLAMLLANRGSRAVKIAAVIALTSSLIAGGVLGTSTASPQNSARPISLHCADSRPVLCLARSYEPARKTIERALATRWARAHGTAFAYNRVELLPRGVGGNASPRALALHVDDLDKGWAGRDTFEMLQIAFDSHTPTGYCYDIAERDLDNKQFGTTSVVEAWLANAKGYVPVRKGSEQAYEHLSSLPVVERTRFLQLHRNELCAGTLSLRAFG